tara:strand:- start:1389 stop:2033 length:645 start_codon:yes stop_codon:yes gene_type:complete
VLTKEEAATARGNSGVSGIVEGDAAMGKAMTFEGDVVDESVSVTSLTRMVITSTGIGGREGVKNRKEEREGNDERGEGEGKGMRQGLRGEITEEEALNLLAKQWNPFDQCKLLFKTDSERMKEREREGEGEEKEEEEERRRGLLNGLDRMIQEEEWSRLEEDGYVILNDIIEKSLTRNIKEGMFVLCSCYVRARVCLGHTRQKYHFKGLNVGLG